MTYKAQEFIDAIPGSGGIITTIAKRVGCSWHTAKRYVTEYATVKQAYNDERERAADRAEQVLLKSINEGDTANAKWYLSRIRRGRFATRQEVTGADGEPLTVEYVNDWRNAGD